MSLLERIKARLSRATVQQGPSRADRHGDPGSSGDEHGTTGPGDRGTFVGRAAGQDTGYLESGAERRAQQESKDEPPERH